MRKQAISVTLDGDNLTWLRGRARATTRSVSETLDRLVSSARTGGIAGEARSVVGTITIDGADPDLKRADEAVRTALARSLARAHAGRRDGPSVRARRSPRG